MVGCRPGARSYWSAASAFAGAGRLRCGRLIDDRGAQLQELIRTALKQNYDLQLATERINAERAQLAITRSDQFPQAQGSGTFSGGKEQNFQTRFNFLSLAADAAFQLDFFGRYRRSTEAARAQLLASEE